MHVVVDLANQVILPQLAKESLHSWISRIHQRIRLILALSFQLRLRPIFVCDAGYTTPEVQQKWKQRREREVERCIRKIPYCADMLVCEMIMQLRLPLVFDKRYNADDIVATIANMHKSSIILSRDMDYFRYDNEEFRNRIFFIGQYRKMLQLYKTGAKREPLDTIRMYFPVFAKNYSDLIKFVSHGLYMRGTAYPAAEREAAKSLHLITRKYRRFLYDGKVLEIFPIWSDSKVVWNKEHIYPGEDTFPSSSSALVDEMIESVGGCINEQHRTTMMIMACELFAAKNKTSLTSEIDAYIRAKHGSCSIALRFW